MEKLKPTTEALMRADKMIADLTAECSMLRLQNSAKDIEIANLKGQLEAEKEERENPEALTIEELREMAERCEPIYITRIDDETPIFRGNKIVGGVLDKAAVMNVADHLPFMAIYGRNLTLAESDYGKTWLAYRTKPIGGIKP